MGSDELASRLSTACIQLEQRTQIREQAVVLIQQTGTETERVLEQSLDALEALEQRLGARLEGVLAALEEAEDRLDTAAMGAEDALSEVEHGVGDLEEILDTRLEDLTEQAETVMDGVEAQLSRAQGGVERILELQGQLARVLAGLDAATSEGEGGIFQAGSELGRLQGLLDSEVLGLISTMQSSFDQAFDQLDQQLALVEQLLDAVSGERRVRGEQVFLEAEVELQGAELGLDGALGDLSAESERGGGRALERAGNVTRSMEDVIRIVEAIRPALDAIQVVLA